MLLATPVVELLRGIGRGEVLIVAYSVDVILLRELGWEAVEQLLLIGNHDEMVSALGELSAVFEPHARGGSGDEC